MVPVPPEHPVKVVAVTPVYVTVCTPAPESTYKVPDAEKPLVELTVMVAEGNTMLVGVV